MQTKELILPHLILDKEAPINEREELSEMFSKAFYEVSKDYFKRKFRVENEIENLKKEQKKSIALGISAMLLGILLSLINTWLILITAIGAIAIIYTHKRYQGLIDKKLIESSELKPEGQIKFISKIYLPFYIVPYNGGSIIIDARSIGNKQTIELKQIDLMSLINHVERLESEIEIFKATFNNVANIDTIRNYDEKILENKTLENKIVEILLTIQRILTNVSINHYEFYLHKPESKTAQTIKLLLKERPDLFRTSSNIGKIPSKLSINDAVKTVSDLKGIESEALKKDIIETIQDCIKRVETSIDELLDVLGKNTKIAGKYYEYLDNSINVLTSRYLCEACHEIREEDYKLTSIINEGLKYTLSTLEDLDEKATINAVKKYVESLSEIGLEIPIDLLSALPIGENIAKIDKSKSVISFECSDKHGEVNNALRSIYEADVLARTAANVFNELKKPILEKAEDMFKELDKASADLRKERLAIAPFEQLYNQLDLEVTKIRSEIESLSHLSNILSGMR